MINSVNSKNPTIERFRKRTIVLHWVHTGAFLILAVTGAIMLLQEDVYSNIYIAQILHRAAAVIFIAVPVLGYFMAPRPSSGFIRESLKFGSEGRQMDRGRAGLLLWRTGGANAPSGTD